MTHPMVSRARIKRDENQEKPTWAERRAAMRYVPKLLGLVWSTHRGLTLTMVLLRIVRSFVPLASLWVGKLIVDMVVRAVQGSADLPRMYRLVALEFAIVVGGDLLARTSSLVESLLGARFANRISVRLREQAATLDLHQSEDPGFYDHLERPRRTTTGRLGLLA